VRDGGVATSRPHAPHIPARALRAVSARDAATAFGRASEHRAVSRCGTGAITGAITGVD